MKKALITIVTAFLLLALTVLVFREQLKEYAYDSITDDMFVEADTDDFDPGPAVGSMFPGLNASYQGEEARLLQPFAGPNGTVLMASRSFDWCPYCMKQMIDLNKVADEFAAAGIGLVAITYDSPELQQAFIDEHGITIPVLSDVDALSFKTLGILNTEYQPGEHHYGIPYPGMIIVNPGGEVVGKLFVEAYSSRVSAEAALDYAKEALGLP